MSNSEGPNRNGGTPSRLRSRAQQNPPKKARKPRASSAKAAASPRSGGTSPSSTRKKQSTQSKPPVPQVRRRVIVILGMHRSGSSVITRGIQALGVDLGDNLMPPAEGNNSKGFFEDLDIYRFNEQLLKVLGSNWYSLRPVDEQRLTGAEFSEYRCKANQLITEKLGTNQLFAFKDPRTAVLIPFWRCVFDNLELEDKYVITVRNPMEIAASLKARDGFDMRRGLYLWAKHAVEAVRHTEGKPRVFVAYDAVLREPLEQLTRLASALDLDPPKQKTKAITQYCDEFLEAGLRHNVVGPKELERSKLAPPFLSAVDAWLRARAKAPFDDVLKRDGAFWDDILARLDEATPLMGLSDVGFAEAASERAAARTAKEALSEAEKNLAAVVSDRDTLRDDLKAKQDECVDIARQRNEMHEALESLRRSNSEETGLLTEAREAAEALSRELEQKLAERDLLLESERAAARTAKEALSEAEKNLAAVVSDRDTLRDDLKAKQDECVDIARQRNEMHEALESLRRSNSEETGLLTEAREAAEALSRELEQKLAERDLLLEKANGELEALKSQLADALRSGETSQALVRALEEQLALAESARDTALMEVRTVADQLNKSQKARDDAYQTAEALRATTQRQQEALKQLEADLTIRQREAGLQAETLARLNETLAGEQRSVAQLTLQLREHEDALADARERIEREQGQREAMQSDLSREKHALEQALGQLKDERRRCTEAQTLLEREKASRESAQHALDDASHARRTLEERASMAEAQAADAAREADRLQERVQALAQQQKDGDAARAAMRTAYMLARAELNAVRTSTSWRLSAPVRALGRIARSPLSGTKAVARQAARIVWRAIPLSPQARGKVAQAAFTVAPFLFFWMPQYKAWSAGRQTRTVRQRATGASDESPG